MVCTWRWVQVGVGFIRISYFKNTGVWLVMIEANSWDSSDSVPCIGGILTGTVVVFGNVSDEATITFG